jgi:hypothetical protein
MMRCSWLASSHPPPEAVDPSRTLLRVALGLGGLALLCLPAVVALRLSWLALAGGPGATIERWTLFAVFYVGWTLAAVVAFVWANDRLGIHWYAHERAVRPGKRRRHRLDAGLRLLDGSRDASGGPRGRRPRQS